MSMSVVEFVKPDDTLIRYIAANMREPDAVEVMATAGRDPLSALQYSVDASTFSTCAVIDGTPVCIFGLAVHGILSGTGIPWMLGTDEIVTKRRAFLPHSRRVIADMLHITGHLYNYAHSDNTVSIRWLKWLGFEFEDSIPYGVNGELFRRFSMRKENV